MSKVRKLLKDVGFNDTDATKFFMYLNHEDGKEMPEDLNDFAYEKAIEKYKADNEELLISKRKDTWIAEHEKNTHQSKWLEFSNPLLNIIKKEGQFADEELKGKQVKDAIKMLVDSKNKAILAASNSMDESHLNTITSLQDEKQELLEKIEAIEIQAESRVKDALESSKSEIYNFHTQRFISDRIHSGVVDFDYEDKIPLYKQLILPRIMSSYRVDYTTGKLSMADGTRAVAFDGNGFYDNVDQAITALAKEMNVIKLSKGGQGTKFAVDRGHIEHQGKTVSLAGTNFLKQQVK